MCSGRWNEGLGGLGVCHAPVAAVQRAASQPSGFVDLGRDSVTKLVPMLGAIHSATNISRRADGPCTGF